MAAVAIKSLRHRSPILPEWRDLCNLSNEELGKYDIAEVNLACAAGLPGSDKIDAELCLRTLDEWAERIAEYTDRVLPQFHSRPVAYRSEADFRVLVMLTVLHRDIGILYNPAKVPEDAQFEPEDTFIHGIIQGNGGTCASLPVVYAAVGRRLGYPIKLVTVCGHSTASHCFARWVGQDGERFNIESSGNGLNTPPDDYYRRGRYEMTTEIEELGCYLQSRTPRMELAGFLSERAIYQEAFGDRRSCIETTAWAVAIHPENRITENTLKLRMNEWTLRQKEQKPPGFPSRIWITMPRPRMFPDTLPIEYERDFHGLKVVDCLLHDPALVPTWEKMRRGEWTGLFPNTAEAVFKPGGGCDIGLHFT